MIYKIEIENFYSIRDAQTLDLRAPANAPKNTKRLAECWSGSSDRAPKVVALFGANGSGKSNVLRVLSFATWFVGFSFSNSPTSRIPFEPFNDEDALRSPTKLKIWTSGVTNLAEISLPGAAKCPYCYELTIRNGERQGVSSEAIYYWPLATQRKTRLIERFEDGTVKAAKDFDFSDYRRALEKVLRPNASVISTLAQLNHPFAQSIVDGASRIYSNIFIEKSEPSDEMMLRHYVDSPELVKRFNREIQRIDVGIRGLDIQSTSEGPRVSFIHEGLKIPMPLVLESHGTRQFLKLFPYLANALTIGGIAIIDELDAAIHPMILPEILTWFHDPANNPYDAQLWMSCQNATLLEDLSKDEIVFCQKDRQGRTEVYSLNDVTAVRRNDNYYKKYLGGVYGAVPHLG